MPISCFPCKRNGLQSFSQDFLDTVITDGFETAFKLHLHEFAEFAHTNQSELCFHIETFLRADNSMRPFLGDTHATLPGKVQTQRRPDKPVPGVVESSGKPVKVYRDELFINWGGTVKNVPRYTFVPRSKAAVINIVNFARRENLRVRVSGSRHSWSHVYGADGEVLISMLELNAAVAKSRFSFPERNPQDNELEKIQFDGQLGTDHAKIRLGAAVTSDHFRRWALDTSGGDWQWMLRALPILTAITSAGWTQVICHGAGIRHKTVSDLVLEVVIVNCNGELQVIRDKELLKAVAGGFGLLGVVVEQVFILDRLKIADFFPRKIPTVLGVPPVDREDVPKVDDFDLTVSDAAIEQARLGFETDCRDFYAEWFWFPFQPEVWVNTWNTSEVAQDRPVYPDGKEIKFQTLQSAVARIFEVSLLKLLPPRKQAELMGFSAMQFLPGGELLRTSVPDALHFRRGIHLLPVRDCEIEIEIPPRADGTSDFSICQKAWWMAIGAVYEALPSAPMRTTLEMRVIGASDVTMSTQRGNDLGTCSIEVLTNTLVDDEEWAAFIEKLTNLWASLKNPIDSRPLRIRPHFAKEWPRSIRGFKIDEYLKEEYKKEIPEFREQLRKTAERGGYSLDEAFGMFGNDTILDFVKSR